MEETTRRRLTGKQAPDPLRRVFNELNQPGVQRFKQALRSRWIQFTDAEVSEIVRGSAARQLQAPRQRYEGKIASSAINQRWAADLIDYTARPAKLNDAKYTHVLIVQDIFSRKIFARPLKGTTPTEVAAAFRSIMTSNGTPLELNTDKGSEFTSGEFPQLLDERGIAHRIKDPQDRNAIATLDRAIQSLKPALSQGNWAMKLDAAVSGQNKAPHGHLMMSAPNEVQGNDVLQFALKQEGARAQEHNEGIAEKRAERLERDGAYRVEEPITKFTRSFKPRFSDKVHQVAAVDGGTVIDTEGNRHSTKFVQAVPKSSANVRSTQFTRGGSAQVEQKKRRLLQNYATSVAALIRAAGGELELWRIGDRLKRMGPGFSIAAREAGLNQKGVIASFLRAFPERFELNIPREGGKATVKLR